MDANARNGLLVAYINDDISRFQSITQGVDIQELGTQLLREYHRGIYDSIPQVTLETLMTIYRSAVDSGRWPFAAAIADLLIDMGEEWSSYWELAYYHPRFMEAITKDIGSSGYAEDALNYAIQNRPQWLLDVLIRGYLLGNISARFLYNVIGNQRVGSEFARDLELALQQVTRSE